MPDESRIKIWGYDDCPKELVALFPAIRADDWIAYVPASLAGAMAVVRIFRHSASVALRDGSVVFSGKLEPAQRNC